MTISKKWLIAVLTIIFAFASVFGIVVYNFFTNKEDSSSFYSGDGELFGANEQGVFTYVDTSSTAYSRLTNYIHTSTVKVAGMLWYIVYQPSSGNVILMSTNFYGGSSAQTADEDTNQMYYDLLDRYPILAQCIATPGDAGYTSYDAPQSAYFWLPASEELGTANAYTPQSASGAWSLYYNQAHPQCPSNTGANSYLCGDYYWERGTGRAATLGGIIGRDSCYCNYGFSTAYGYYPIVAHTVIQGLSNNTSGLYIPPQDYTLPLRPCMIINTARLSQFASKTISATTDGTVGATVTSAGDTVVAKNIEGLNYSATYVAPTGYNVSTVSINGQEVALEDKVPDNWSTIFGAQYKAYYLNPNKKLAIVQINSIQNNLTIIGNFIAEPVYTPPFVIAPTFSGGTGSYKITFDDNDGARLVIMPADGYYVDTLNFGTAKTTGMFKTLFAIEDETGAFEGYVYANQHNNIVVIDFYVICSDINITITLDTVAPDLEVVTPTAVNGGITGFAILSSPGGEARMIGSTPEEENVTLVAVPYKGFTFQYWQTSSGKILQNAEEINLGASCVVPKTEINGTIVTAIFESDISGTPTSAGLPSNTITVTCANDLYLLSMQSQQGINFSNIVIRLEKDIDMSTRAQGGVTIASKWIPLGNDSGNPFAGVFDYNGYTISGVTTIIKYTTEDAVIMGNDGTFADLQETRSNR